MQTIIKVLDELGLIILDKENQIELKQREIDKLKRKINAIEHYLEMYEEHCNYDFPLKKR